MDMLNQTQITIAWELWELHEKGISNTKIASDLSKHRETIGLWITQIQEHGLLGFLDIYTNAKKVPREKRQVDTLIKCWVWDIRDREMECCGQKIQYFLQLEHNTHLSVPKIYEILSEKYVIRSKWKKNKQRGMIPVAARPREVVQMDTIDFGNIYAFTGIDIFSREADVFLAPELTSKYGEIFLDQSMERRFDGYVGLIQTDGGPEFKDSFKKKVSIYCERHRISRPYRKNEQSYIESFNRTVRKECLGWTKYRTSQLEYCQKLVETFLDRYHYHRPHMGLGMRPPLDNSKEDCRIFTEN
jgi:transposase InsO family protein